MFLSDISIKRPVFATMMMLALVVVGAVSYKRLAVDEYPDVTYPIISVQASYPGASPEVVERDVIRPIETALNTVEGLYELTSTSSEGGGNVNAIQTSGVLLRVGETVVATGAACWPNRSTWTTCSRWSRWSRPCSDHPSPLHDVRDG